MKLSHDHEQEVVLCSPENLGTEASVASVCVLYVCMYSMCGCSLHRVCE